MIPIGASEDYDGGTVGLNEETVPPLVVQVEAPATLSAGYIFWATLSNNGDPFPVRVVRVSLSLSLLAVTAVMALGGTIHRFFCISQSGARVPDCHAQTHTTIQQTHLG